MAEPVDYRRPTDADHDAIVRRFDDWAGGRTARQLLPRLWFRHFTGTSWVAARDDGRVIGIAIGFLGQDDPSVAVLHVIAVDPRHRRRGVGSELAARFVRDAATRGATTARTTAWPDDRPTHPLPRGGRLPLVDRPTASACTACPRWPTTTGPATTGPSSSGARVHGGMRRAGSGASSPRSFSPPRCGRLRRCPTPAANLAIGDCFDVPTTADITTIPTTACTETHGAEVFHTFDARGGGAYPTDEGWGQADLPGLRSGLQDIHRDRGRGPDRHRLPLLRADERPLGGRRPPRDVLHPGARRQPARPFVPGKLLTFDAFA